MIKLILNYFDSELIVGNTGVAWYGLARDWMQDPGFNFC